MRVDDVRNQLAWIEKRLATAPSEIDESYVGMPLAMVTPTLSVNDVIVLNSLKTLLQSKLKGVDSPVETR